MTASAGFGDGAAVGDLDVLGCHIEMTTTPGRDYPVGWSYQPDKPPLQLTPGISSSFRTPSGQTARTQAAMCPLR